MRGFQLLLGVLFSGEDTSGKGRSRPPLLRLPCQEGALSKLRPGRPGGARWREGRGRVCRAVADAGPFDGSGQNGQWPKQSRQEILLEYVRTVQPEFMDHFFKRAPEQVVEAMRQTVTNMIGTLPAQFFEITVSTVGENLAQLMYSVMMTGYMFRNAQYRVDLTQSMAAALPDPDRPRLGDPNYEEGVQKAAVGGEVLRWHKQHGPAPMAAADYIELLEGEVAALRAQLEAGRRAAQGRNPLLDYLKGLQPQNLQELTASAGEDVLVAMNAFIQRLLGVTDGADLKASPSETSATELANLLYWLMVVGYSIRNIEVRYDMERVLGAPLKLGELPSGEQ